MQVEYIDISHVHVYISKNNLHINIIILYVDINYKLHMTTELSCKNTFLRVDIILTKVWLIYLVHWISKYSLEQKEIHIDGCLSVWMIISITRKLANPETLADQRRDIVCFMYIFSCERGDPYIAPLWIWAMLKLIPDKLIHCISYFLIINTYSSGMSCSIFVCQCMSYVVRNTCLFFLQFWYLIDTQVQYQNSIKT